MRKETSYVYNTKAEAEADADNVEAGLERKSSRRVVLSQMIARICRRKQVTRFRDPMKPVKKRHFPYEKNLPPQGGPTNMRTNFHDQTRWDCSRTAPVSLKIPPKTPKVCLNQVIKGARRHLYTSLYNLEFPHAVSSSLITKFCTSVLDVST